MTDKLAPSLPPVEALQQLVAKWRHDAQTAVDAAKGYEQRRIDLGDAISVTLDNCADELEAAIPSPQTWQPLETAPTDGTHVLLEGPQGVDIGWWQDKTEPGMDGGIIVDPGFDAGWFGRWHYFPSGSVDDVPTHWQPLPDSPVASPRGGPAKE